MGHTSEASDRSPFTERGATGHLAWARTAPLVDLVLLHGFSDSADCWGPLVGALQGPWEALAIDARGHGSSGLPEETFGRTAHARDVAQVLDALAAEGGVRSGGAIVAGHSMGAVTAAAFAESRPDLVAAVILEDPPPGQRQPSEGTPPRRLTPDWLVAARDRDLPERIATNRAGNPDWPDDEHEPWALSKERFDMHVFDLPSEPMAYLPGVLPKVSCPVLLLYGDTDRGSLISAEVAAECANAAAGEFASVHIEGAGHNIRRDRREPYLAAVTEFLRRYAG
ncbi:alpha/beta hydrolase [Actinopolymorpha sp. B17G11]|uniref:alpha/beta fold hydrolase n=1 Tax=unclassified Actinopolymorpha TaxID=2627063 RepID=UPI0032D92268